MRGIELGEVTAFIDDSGNVELQYDDYFYSNGLAYSKIELSYNELKQLVDEVDKLTGDRT